MLLLFEWAGWAGEWVVVRGGLEQLASGGVPLFGDQLFLFGGRNEWPRFKARWFINLRNE